MLCLAGSSGVPVATGPSGYLSLPSPTAAGLRLGGGFLLGRGWGVVGPRVGPGLGVGGGGVFAAVSPAAGGLEWVSLGRGLTPRRG